MKLMIILLFGLALGGCSKIEYRHPTKDTQAFNKDFATCSAQGGQACGGSLTNACKDDIRDKCLRGEGWVKTLTRGSGYVMELN